MSDQKTEALYQFTLSSKKVIKLREPKIGHSRTAAQVAGKKAGDNNAYLQMLIQEEIAKLLIVEVDGKILSAIEKENLDNLFSIKEYSQVLQAIQMIGGEDEGKPVMVIDTSGA